MAVHFSHGLCQTHGVALSPDSRIEWQSNVFARYDGDNLAGSYYDIEVDGITVESACLENMPH